MTVRVVHKKSGEETVGKYAAIKDREVSLYTGIMSDKKGGWRGCGKRIVFPSSDVTVTADDPAKEMKRQS